MKNVTAIVPVVLLLGAAAFVWALYAKQPEQLELAFIFALRVMGIGLAVVVWIGLFVQLSRGATVGQLLPGGVVLLGAMLIASPTWSAALALALVLAATAVAPIQERRRPEHPAEPPQPVDRNRL